MWALRVLTPRGSCPWATIRVRRRFRLWSTVRAVMGLWMSRRVAGSMMVWRSCKSFRKMLAMSPEI